MNNLDQIVIIIFVLILQILNQVNENSNIDFLTIANVGLEYNFEKYPSLFVNTLNTPYDYASIMHYGRGYFSINGKPTIEPLQTGVVIEIRYNMSLIDIQEVQLTYNCASDICKYHYGLLTFILFCKLSKI